LLKSHYAKEIWGLYEDGELHPESVLTGYFEESTEEADVDGVMEEIKSILAEQEARQQRMAEAEESS
jgi:RIO kinase 1